MSYSESKPKAGVEEGKPAAPEADAPLASTSLGEQELGEETATVRTRRGFEEERTLLFAMHVDCTIKVFHVVGPRVNLLQTSGVEFGL